MLRYHHTDRGHIIFRERMMVAYVAVFLAGVAVGGVAVIGVIALISFAISWAAQKEVETFATTADRLGSH